MMRICFFLHVAILTDVSAAQEQTCGIRAAPKERIVNGQESVPCDHPWQVSLRDRQGHFCGGTLISKRWVFTAAHCVAGLGSDLRVTVGDHGVTGKGDNHEKTYNVSTFISHPNYDDVTMDFDFALIKLGGDVEYNECVAPACMPDEDVAVGATCMTTGWGTLYSDGPSPEYLQEGEVQIWPSNACNKRKRYNGEITSSMVCAQGRSESGIIDACQGDSGGPLVCEANGVWTLHGATSWGEGCAKQKYPGVWSRVYYVKEWVKTMTTPVSLPPGQMWEVVGPCTKVETDGQECIQSPNYPGKYDNSQTCSIRIDETQAQEMWIEDFKTERHYDSLIINGQHISGHKPNKHYPTHSFVPQDPISWAADSSGTKSGWVICANKSQYQTSTPPQETCSGKKDKFDSYCRRKCDRSSNCHGQCQRKCNANCACNASRRLQGLGIAMKSELEFQDEDIEPVVLV